jgi:hypothetical protein
LAFVDGVSNFLSYLSHFLLLEHIREHVFMYLDDYYLLKLDLHSQGDVEDRIFRIVMEAKRSRLSFRTLGIGMRLGFDTTLSYFLDKIGSPFLIAKRLYCIPKVRIEFLRARRVWRI